MAYQIGKPGCEEEAKMMPVFTVRKKGSVLKNIFLNGPPPELRSPGGSPGEPRPEEEKVLIGRHPDCHVVVDHPSISRFHLEIRVRPSSQKLAVVDLSSVHGTWVSGNKIEPRIPVDLAEGDMVRLGASTRVYELHWVPVSSALDWDKPLPALPEEQEQIHQGENGGIPAIDHFSFESWANQIPSAPPMPESFEYPMLSPVVPSVGENQKTGAGAVEEMVSSSIPVPEIFEYPLHSPVVWSVGENQKPRAGALEEMVSSSIPVLEILSSSSPLEGQENRVPEAEASPKSPEAAAAPISERRVSSSLLSRRSKSISFLRVHTGRSREKLGTPGFDAGKQEENVVVLEQVRKEETLCKVLFSNLDWECTDEETNFSDKENMTPGVSGSRMLQKNQMGLQRSLYIDAALCEKKEWFFSDMEDCTPQVSQAMGEACKGEDSSIKSGRQGEEEEEIYVSDKENMTPEVSHNPSRQKNQIGKQRYLNIGAALDEKEEGFFSDKENCTPQVPHAKRRVCIGAESSVKSGIQGEEEIYVSDKENMTPEVSHNPERQKNLMGSQRSLNIDAALDEKEEGFFSDKENCTPHVPHSRRQVYKGAQSSIKSGRQGEEQEIYVSVKENKKTQVSEDQTSRDLSSTRRGIEGEIIKRRVDRIPFQSLFESSRGKNSPLAGRIPFQSLGEKSASKSSASSAKLSPANSNLGKKSTIVSRIPFQSLDEKSASKKSASPADITTTANNHLITHSQKFVPKSTNISMPAEQVHHKVEVTKKWYMVADTSCFLDEETRKAMQLLEGLRGTYLIIPRMVIRELDCLRRRESYFRKTSKASSALQWIEECMVKTSWWIHVQNSMESISVAPTPPASPQVQDNSELHRPVSDPLLYSTCGSLAEILSPTAEDHILDCALLFKKIKSDGQLVLLTNEVSLKIKAMAEGLLCESAQEFRQSLVNPFSQRFLWADSSPRGPTWSCSGQVSGNGCSNQWPIMKKTTKAVEGAKGLKLILLHNSHYAQANLIKDR